MEENLDKPSGMICIDIDGKDNPGTDLNAFALTMRKDPSVIMISKSASGEGLMIIHRIEVREGSAPDDLRLHFFELESIYKESGIVIDDACKNINRLRYATHDPDLYAIEDPHHAEIRPLPKPIQRRDPVTATPTKTPTNLTQTPTTAPDKENRYTRPRKPSVFDYDEEDLRFATAATMGSKEAELADGSIFNLLSASNAYSLGLVRGAGSGRTRRTSSGRARRN